MAASTATSCPLLEVSHRRLPASTGPDQVLLPGSLVVHWILPSRRVIAMSCPVVSTTNTESPATHGACTLGTVSDHTRSPVFCAVATMRPAWPTANTVPPSMAGRAVSLMADIDEPVRVRASDRWRCRILG